jgi:hypothetical protein
MKKVFFILALAADIICLSSCKKEKTTEESTPVVQEQCPAFSGYTATDVLGDFLGISDTTDWQLNDQWNQCEQNLFTNTNYNSNCVFDDTMLTRPNVFPNPTFDLFRFDIGIHFIPSDSNLVNRDTLIKMDLVILNQRHEQLASIHTNKRDVRLMNFSLDMLDNLPADTMFRVYYKLTDPNNCIRLGHGDVIRH